ncbi:MAG: MBOAT family O-acyltransferase [Pseudomonadota bacterium]|uniref:MBOAT family O-acyltransferase n=1 Tax=Methyloversatilis sp. TaxID=2569862 RepID=UPI0027335F05|nr:MBOAT family O-acyltransferase [Methyloversatilis sp.]MDP3872678.1 MBOAT family O-acyltransferase [Methyloversatilis sp.]
MIFSQPIFFVFLAALLCVYSLCRTHTERAVTLLVGSLIFYASWKPAYLILLVLSVSLNYLFYSALARTRSKRLLVTALVLNLALLGSIKYLGMLIDSVIALAAFTGHTDTGLDSSWTHWALPLGISFYTFHMLSVMIDVYRGEWNTRISFRAWWLYISFFPHMVAGPILRASELVEQLERLEPLQARDLKLGALIFMGGLIKKVLFADNFAGLADELWTNPERLDTATAWLAVTAFALQIYFDFSGYSEMAIGLARGFGVTLPRNFLYPYISRNPQEFWQRWHITLSRWLRDYLYVSLGGNRSGQARTIVNLMITMVLGGLWHGAAWNFVIWGFLHGSWLAAHRLARPWLPKPQSSFARTAYAFASWAVSLTIVWVTWVFFRAAGTDLALTMCARMFGLSASDGSPPEVRTYVWALTALTGLLVLLEPRLVSFADAKLNQWAQVPALVRSSLYATIILAVIIFGGSTQRFIYFDF